MVVVWESNGGVKCRCVLSKEWVECECTALCKARGDSRRRKVRRDYLDDDKTLQIDDQGSSCVE
jgi:hypothetical protein